MRPFCSAWFNLNHVFALQETSQGWQRTFLLEHCRKFYLAEIYRLYDCHDKLLEHKTALFDHLTERWRTLFNAKFEVLLYDLTSTYFESNPPEDPDDIRRFGYSRDKRSDCVQVVIALIVTPDGFPIAYEVLSGNTTDKTTLADFLKKIETQYGKGKTSKSSSTNFNSPYLSKPRQRSTPRCRPRIEKSM